MRWRRSIAVIFFALTACQAAPATIEPPSGLSPLSTEAYLVLMDQLVEWTSSSRIRTDTYCVSVQTTDDPDGAHLDAALLEQLRTDARAKFDVEVVEDSKCAGDEFGAAPQENLKVGLHLYASNTNADPARQRTWMAGYSCGDLCGDLCGEGSFYVIDRTSGAPVAKRTSSFIN